MQDYLILLPKNNIKSDSIVEQFITFSSESKSIVNRFTFYQLNKVIF